MDVLLSDMSKGSCLGRLDFHWDLHAYNVSQIVQKHQKL